MKISSVVANEYQTVFVDQTIEQRTPQIKAIQYLMMTAQNLGIRIGDWDLFHNFGNPDKPGFIHTDKQTLNRILFEKMAAQKPKEGENAKMHELGKDVAQQIQESIQRHIDELIENTEQSWQSYQEDVHSYMQSAEERLVIAHKEYMKLVALRNGEGAPNVLAEIETINKAGFWEFKRYNKTDNKIEFRTRETVRASYIDKAAGLDMVVDFGRFKCTISLADGALRVRGAGNNLKVRDSSHIHPHIDGRNNGVVCWGTAAAMVKEKLPKFQFAQPMEALSIILTTYNPASPYCALERFYQAQTERALRPPPKQVKCEACGITRAEGKDCACVECSVCKRKEDGRKPKTCTCCYRCGSVSACACAEGPLTTGEPRPVPLMDPAIGAARYGAGALVHSQHPGHYGHYLNLLRNDPMDTLQLRRSPRQEPGESRDLYNFRQIAFGGGAFGHTTLAGLQRTVVDESRMGRMTPECAAWVEKVTRAMTIAAGRPPSRYDDAGELSAPGDADIVF